MHNYDGKDCEIFRYVYDYEWDGCEVVSESLDEWVHGLELWMLCVYKSMIRLEAKPIALLAYPLIFLLWWRLGCNLFSNTKGHWGGVLLVLCSGREEGNQVVNQVLRRRMYSFLRCWVTLLISMVIIMKCNANGNVFICKIFSWENVIVIMDAYWYMCI